MDMVKEWCWVEGVEDAACGIPDLEISTKVQKLYKGKLDWRPLKTIYQNSLDVILLILAVDTNNRTKFLEQGPKLAELLGNGNGVTGAGDLVRTIKVLLEKAERYPNFSFNYYNMIVSYIVRAIPVTQAVLLQGAALSDELRTASYEKVTFPQHLRLVPVLKPNQQLTLQRVVKHCEK